MLCCLPSNSFLKNKMADSRFSPEIQKRIKLDNEIFSDGSLESFEFKKILREDQRSKLMCLMGRIRGRDEPAVLLLEKEQFQKDSLPRIFSSETSLKETMKNDIYRTFKVKPSSEFAGFKSTLIFPATQKHIDKYSDYQQFIVCETPQLYGSVTVPCLKKSNFSLQWVYNILEKKSEAERIVFEDPDPEIGFVMLPDMKWDGSAMESLYLVAIVKTRNVGCLRDLQKKHLPLLENVLDKGTECVLRLYGVPRSQQRVYVHYQPSYPHLHVHFTHVQLDAPGTDVLRAHLLQDVIENIQMFDDFYQKKSLLFSVRENHELFKAYKEVNYFD